MADSSSDNFFKLVIDLNTNINLLNQLIVGGSQDTVEIDGEVKPSISKDIADKWQIVSLDIQNRWVAIQALVDSALVFETKADMDAFTPSTNSDGQYPLAKVWKDTVTANNAVYGYKNGAWVVSGYDPLRSAYDVFLNVAKRKATNLISFGDFSGGADNPVVRELDGYVINIADVTNIKTLRDIGLTYALQEVSNQNAIIRHTLDNNAAGQYVYASFVIVLDEDVDALPEINLFLASDVYNYEFVPADEFKVRTNFKIADNTYLLTITGKIPESGTALGQYSDPSEIKEIWVGHVSQSWNASAYVSGFYLHLSDSPLEVATLPLTDFSASKKELETKTKSVEALAETSNSHSTAIDTLQQQAMSSESNIKLIKTSVPQNLFVFGDLSGGDDNPALRGGLSTIEKVTIPELNRLGFDYAFVWPNSNEWAKYYSSEDEAAALRGKYVISAALVYADDVSKLPEWNCFVAYSDTVYSALPLNRARGSVSISDNVYLCWLTGQIPDSGVAFDGFGENDPINQIWCGSGSESTTGDVYVTGLYLHASDSPITVDDVLIQGYLTNKKELATFKSRIEAMITQSISQTLQDAASQAAQQDNEQVPVIIQTVTQMIESGVLEKSVTIANSDRIMVCGDSYTQSSYTPRDKAWISKVSQFSDYLFDNYAVAGETYRGNITRILNNDPTYHSSLGWQDAKPKYAFLFSYTNDMKVLTDTEYLADLDEIIQITKAYGAQPIVSTEYHVGYGRAVINGMRKVAETNECPFFNLIPYVKQIRGTDYGPYWLSSHPGVRSNHIIADPLMMYFDQLPRPTQAIKIYRERSSYGATSIADLVYINRFDRAAKWREISVGHSHLAVDDYDYMDTLADDGLYSTEKQFSEYLMLQNNEAVSLSTRTLIECILPVTARDLMSLRLTLTGDSPSAVYALTRGTSPASLTELTLNEDGDYVLTSEELSHTVHLDKVMFFIESTTELTLTDIAVNYIGGQPKPNYPLPRHIGLTYPHGAELLPQTLFDTAAISSWTLTDVTESPFVPSDGNMPRLATEVITLPVGASVHQSISWTKDNIEDLPAIVAITARYNPAQQVVASALGEVTEDSFDYGELSFSIDIDSGDTVSMPLMFGMHWKRSCELVTLANDLNSGVFKITNTGNKPMELALSSIKMVV